MTGKQDTADNDGRKWLEADQRATAWLRKNADNRSDALRDEVKDIAIANYLGEGKNRLEVYLDRALKDAMRKTRNSARHDSTENADSKGDLSVDGGAKLEASAQISQILQPKTVQVSFSNIDVEPVVPQELKPEQLKADLVLLASRYRMASETRPDDERLWMLSRVLLAITNPHYDSTDIAGKANRWLDANNQGPGSKAQELASLRALMVRAQLMGDTRAAAEAIVKKLRCRPVLAALARVPVAHAPWDDTAKHQAIAAVEGALTRLKPTKPETLARAVMEALGMPRAKSLFDGQRKAKARKKKTADK